MLPNFELLRFKFIEQQVRTWNVLDADVLQALRKIQREYFLPEYMRSLTFCEMQLPLLESTETNQVMLEPKLEAKILEIIKPDNRTDAILEIGTGSGYMAALLSFFSDNIISIEKDEKILNFAKENFEKNNIKNIQTEQGDAYFGWGENKQQYSRICVSGSMSFLSKKLKSQLIVGGKLFVILGTFPLMHATLITRLDQENFEKKSLFETIVPALISEKVKQKKDLFSF